MNIRQKVLTREREDCKVDESVSTIKHRTIGISWLFGVVKVKTGVFVDLGQLLNRDIRPVQLARHVRDDRLSQLPELNQSRDVFLTDQHQLMNQGSRDFYRTAKGSLSVTSVRTLLIGSIATTRVFVDD